MKLKALLGLDLSSLKLASGERLQLSPLTLRQSLIVERAFAPIAEAMADRGMEALEIYGENADDLLLVVAAAANKTPEEVGEWTWPDFQAALGKILEINQNFFSALVVQGAARAAAKSKDTATGAQLSSA